MSLKCLQCVAPLPDEHSGSCPGCGWFVPADYAEVCAKQPPFWAAVAGFSGHGKTTLLDAIVAGLTRLKNGALPGFNCFPQNQQTHAAAKRARVSGGRGERSTDPTTEKTPWLLKITGPFGDRYLCLVDLPGESFHHLDRAAEELPILQEAAVLWLVLSLDDLKNDTEGNTPDGLLQSVHEALSRLKRAPTKARKQDLVVVFSKAEKCILNWPFPREVKQYLTEDPLEKSRWEAEHEPIELTGYMLELEACSAKLRQFAQHASLEDLGVGAMVSMAESHHYNARYCLTSSFGDAPEGGSHSPVRVIDPLMLSLRAASAPATPIKTQKKPPCILVLDATTNPGPLYSKGLQNSLWTALHDNYSVATYYLGTLRTEFIPGRQPPSGNDREPRLRLLGPILEKQPDDCLAIVLSNGPVLDLEDFRAGWKDRLLLVRLDATTTNEIWPKRLFYREGDTAETIVNMLTARTA